MIKIPHIPEPAQKLLIFSFMAPVFLYCLHQVTPLHMAAREGRTDIVKYLVDKRAHINTGDNDRVSV